MPRDKALEQARDTNTAEARNPSILAYEARRCHVCDAPHPSFGFGPPLTRKGHDVWACSLHRAEVKRLLRVGTGFAEAADAVRVRG